MPTLDDFARLLSREGGLCVVTTLRPDLTMQSSVVNAGVMDHPSTEAQVVAIVARSSSRKLVHLRERPQITIVMRVGWEWLAVEGTAQLVGPDDPSPQFDADYVRVLLREAFSAAGGEHDDWDEYDRVMAAERRTVVFVTPTRLYSNG
jgi:PPOX class probable F420-dependent enzyme